MKDEDCWDWFYNNIIDQIEQDRSTYDGIKILRMSLLLFSSLVLIVNIFFIIKKKQYKYNTIKLFMFVEIFYVLSLLSEVAHNPSFNLNIFQFITEGKDETKFSKYQFYNCIITSGQIYWTAIEGYINMSCYSLSYWFAVCITLYIKHVLENTHRQFMKKRGPLIFLVCASIVLWFSVPFILSFFQGMPFSFGPTGYKFPSQKNGIFFFYGGIVNRQDSEGDNYVLGKVLVLLWMLTFPIILFTYHIYLLCKNTSYIKRLVQLDQINPREYFLIKTGRLSFIIFFVQIFNGGKLALSIILQNGEDWATYFLFVVNVLFDLMPLVLIYIYFKYYYREGRDLQQRTELMGRSLVSSYNSGNMS